MYRRPFAVVYLCAYYGSMEQKKKNALSKNNNNSGFPPCARAANY